MRCSPDVLSQLVCRSESMRVLRERLAEIIENQQPVLLHGQCGVGKSWLASLIHQATRNHHPFEIVVCEDLSHEQEAWSLRGLSKRGISTPDSTEGAFQRTKSGTLVLEWLDKLSNVQQGAVLSVLSQHRFARYGEIHTRPFQGRIIATLSQNPYSRHLPIRQELLARFADNTLNIPPLSEREEDFPELVQHLLRDMQSSLQLTPETYAFLAKRSWPRNCHDLRSFLRSLSKNNTVAQVKVEDCSAALQTTNIQGISPTGQSPYDPTKELEKEKIRQAMQRHNGNASKAAAELRMNRTTLLRKLTQYNQPFQGVVFPFFASNSRAVDT